MVSLLLVVLLVSQVQLLVSYSTYLSYVPNGQNVAGSPALGHMNTAGGGTLSAFGQGFALYGHSWTVVFCQSDSDSDGQSNGLELGDPCCVWSRDLAPFRTTLISNPSDANSRTAAVMPVCTGTPVVQTTTTTSSSCRDIWGSQTCAAYVNAGWCITFLAVGENCALSCGCKGSTTATVTGTIPSTTTLACRNNWADLTCTGYASYGWCQTSQPVMQNCMFTCGCGVAPGPSTTSSSSTTSTNVAWSTTSSRVCRNEWADTSCATYASYGWCQSNAAVLANCLNSCGCPNTAYTTTTSKTFFTSTACIDAWPLATCQQVASMGWCRTNETMHDNCQATCGCGVFVPLTTTSTATTYTYTIPGQCLNYWDDGSCQRYFTSNWCSSMQDVRSNCRLSCQACDDTTPLPTPCVDLWPTSSCVQYSSLCTINTAVLSNCQSTCGCNIVLSGATTASATTPTTTTSTTTVPGWTASTTLVCQNIYDDSACGYYASSGSCSNTAVQLGCQRTCGVCQTSPPQATSWCPNMLRSDICEAYTALCSINDYIRANCQQTCGCTGPSTTTTASTSSMLLPTTSTTSTTRPVNCSNVWSDGDCQQYAQSGWCASIQAVVNNCVASCGICTGITPTPSCHNVWTNELCQSYASLCLLNPYVQQYCFRTCGCSGSLFTLQTTAATTSPTTSSVSRTTSACLNNWDDNSCLYYSSLCNTSNEVKLNCQKNCGCLPPSQTVACVNIWAQNLCVSYAAAGICNSNALVKTNCAFYCQCGGSIGTSSPTTSTGTTASLSCYNVWQDITCNSYASYGWCQTSSPVRMYCAYSCGCGS